MAAVIFRDHCGEILDGTGVKKAVAKSVLQGELAAIRLACVMARERCFLNVNVDLSDCKKAVQLSVSELDQLCACHVMFKDVMEKKKLV